MRNPDAVIFDFDGTLFETQHRHAQTESALLAECGVVVSHEVITRRYAGTCAQRMFFELLSEHASHSEDECKQYAEDMTRRKWEILMQPDSIGRVVWMLGARKLVTSFSKTGVLLGVGSASRQAFCTAVLNHHNVTQLFSAIVGGDMVSQGKPEPEIFLLVANMLGANPERCLVIGDSVHDMDAAARANMACIGLQSNGNASDGPYHGATIVRRLTDITPDLVEGVMHGR